MKNSDLTRGIARRTGLTQAQAADQLQRLVREIVTSLRKGQEASLPGLGRFTPGPKWEFQFDPEETRRMNAKR